MEDGYKDRLRKLTKGKKLILASNRGPYSFSYDEAGRLKPKRGGGGLVSALLSLVTDIDTVWFSIANDVVDQRIGLKGAIIDSNNHSAVKFVTVNEKTYNSYYNTMSNEVLWFLQHGLLDAAYTPNFGDRTHHSWQAYKRVNFEFAKALANEIKGYDAANTVIFFHDYHLYLAANYLKNVTATKMHFTHIPWPSSEIMSVLPASYLTEIIKGLLSNDLVGFHCQNYVSNFLNTCEDLGLPVNRMDQSVLFANRKVPVKAFPISIDANSLIEEAKEIKGCAHKDSIGSNKMIFRADRVEPSKNIVRGFLAFERLLEISPELIGNVNFVAFLYESRSDLLYYQEYLKQIKSTVERINKRFSKDDYLPIHLRVDDNYLETLAAYKHFDVLLVNSIADGMNLVAKEGPLLNEKDGVVVLSKRTGAHGELSKFCLEINPFEIDETALTIKKALLMSAPERSARSSFLKQIVMKNSSAKWLYHQLSAVNLQKTQLSLAS